MLCNKCGSENTQRLEVAYEGGTQDISARSHTASVGSISGALGLGGSVTKTTGTSQSVLAKKAAPPLKKPLKMPLIGVTIGGFIAFGSGFRHVSDLVFGFVIIGVGGFFFKKALQYNNNEWPIKYQYWINSWLCHKCGHIFHSE